MRKEKFCQISKQVKVWLYTEIKYKLENWDIIQMDYFKVSRYLVLSTLVIEL